MYYINLFFKICCVWFYILTIWCKSANQGIKYSCKKRNLQYISWFLLPEVTAARFNILSALLSKKLNARAQNRENTHMMAPVEKKNNRKMRKNTVKYIQYRGEIKCCRITEQVRFLWDQSSYNHKIFSGLYKSIVTFTGNYFTALVPVLR